MTFDKFNRRTHLYLAMFLMPWFFMYGVSAIPFSHSSWFKPFYEDRDSEWALRFERSYSLDLPANQDGDREIGAQILKDLELYGVAFGTYRPDPRTMYVYMPKFTGPTQITFSADEQRLVVQDKKFRWDHFLTSMHARGGYDQDRLLDDAWAVVVDIVMIAIVLWIASGVYMWWHIPGQRFWGWVTMGGGLGSFLLLLFGM